MGRVAISVEELTAAEELIMAAIADGSYFVGNETLTGLVNGANAEFTLATAPNPASLLKLYVGGKLMTGGGEDYTLVTDTITFVTAPPTGAIIRAFYTVDPN